MIEQVKEFYDNYVEKLSVKNARHQLVCRSLDRFIPKGCTVLDIGCGTGITSRHLAEGGRTVVAVDLSGALIARAEQDNPHENIMYRQADICEFPITPFKFDAIVMVDVLEHILPESRSRLLEVLRDVSHEATRIYLNIPSPDVLRYLRKNKPKLLQIVDNPVDTGHILDQFAKTGFVPAHFRFYWQQYVEYLFVTKQEFDKTMTRMFM